MVNAQAKLEYARLGAKLAEETFPENFLAQVGLGWPLDLHVPCLPFPSYAVSCLRASGGCALDSALCFCRVQPPCRCSCQDRVAQMNAFPVFRAQAYYHQTVATAILQIRGTQKVVIKKLSQEYRKERLGERRDLLSDPS